MEELISGKNILILGSDLNVNVISALWLNAGQNENKDYRVGPFHINMRVD